MSRGQGKSVRWASSLLQAGFTMYPNVVMLREDLTPHAKVVYGLLCHYARESESAFPGKALLHDKVPCSIRGLKNATDELEAARLVVSIQRGRGRTNQYVLLDPANAETPQEAKERIKAAQRAEEQDRHVVPIKNGTSCRSGPARGADPCVKKTQKKKTHQEQPPKAPSPGEPAGGELVQMNLLDTRGLKPSAQARVERTRRRLQRQPGPPDPTNGAS